jgi:hypothetical protein
MSPTTELRFVVRPAQWVDGERIEARRMLQQKWVQHHIPAGESSAPFEWRDVETVKETK